MDGRERSRRKSGGSSGCQKTHGELERAEALSIFNRARRRVRRVRGDFCGGKSHFPEQKSLPCSFCARKSERFQQKLVGVCLHSYNDTVNANRGLIIKRFFADFRLLRGCKFQVVHPLYRAMHFAATRHGSHPTGSTHSARRSGIQRTIRGFRHGVFPSHSR